MDIIGIKIEERSKDKTVLSLHRDKAEDYDIKVVSGKVTWFRENSVLGIEDAQEIADKAVELSMFWKRFKGKTPQKIQFGEE